MNQQWNRRFRTPKEAKGFKEKVERNGERLPDEKAFDNNCITQGEFPTSLSLRSPSERIFLRDPIHGSTIRADAGLYQQHNHRLELAGRVLGERSTGRGRAQGHGVHSSIEGTAGL